MTNHDKTSFLSRIPAWLAMPLMTIMALGLVAFALTRSDPNRCSISGASRRGCGRNAISCRC